MNLSHTWSLGKLRGVPVGVHWSAVLIVALWTLSIASTLEAMGSGSATRYLVAVASAVGLVASVLAHELGHVAAARACGSRVRRVTLWGLGGVAEIEGPMRSPGAAFGVAVAGPAVSVGVAAGWFGVALAAGHLGADRVVLSAAVWLSVMNVVLAAFNLVPIYPLDGGRVLAALLWKLTRSRPRAELWASSVGRVAGFAVGGWGLWGVLHGRPTFWWVVLGAFIAAQAAREQLSARVELAVEGRTVADVAAPLAAPVAPGVTLHGAAAMGLEGKWVPIAGRPGRVLPPNWHPFPDYTPVELAAWVVSDRRVDPDTPLLEFLRSVEPEELSRRAFVVAGRDGTDAGVVDLRLAELGFAGA